MYTWHRDSAKSDKTHAKWQQQPFKAGAGQERVGEGTDRWTKLWVGGGGRSSFNFLWCLYVKFTCNTLLGLSTYTWSNYFIHQTSRLYICTAAVYYIFNYGVPLCTHFVPTPPCPNSACAPSPRKHHIHRRLTLNIVLNRRSIFIDIDYSIKWYLF